MASVLALNKFAYLTILRKALLQSVCPVAAAPPTSRLLNTSAVRERVYDDDDDEYEEGDLDVGRGLIRRPMLSGIYILMRENDFTLEVIIASLQYRRKWAWKKK